METNNPINPNVLLLAEHFSLEKADVSHPVYHKPIIQYKQKDKSLIEPSK